MLVLQRVDNIVKILDCILLEKSWRIREQLPKRSINLLEVCFILLSHVAQLTLPHLIAEHELRIVMAEKSLKYLDMR